MMGSGTSPRRIVRLGRKEAGLAHLGGFRTLLRMLRVEASCRHDPSWSRAKNTFTEEHRALADDLTDKLFCWN